MCGINEYGRTAEEIACIIAEMNPNISLKTKDEFTTDTPNDISRRKYNKSRLDVIERYLEDKAIEIGSYESKTVHFYKPKKPQ